jgi:hypothetical protein
MVGVCTLEQSVTWLHPLFGRTLRDCCGRALVPLVSVHGRDRASPTAGTRYARALRRG